MGGITLFTLNLLEWSAIRGKSVRGPMACGWSPELRRWWRYSGFRTAKYARKVRAGNRPALRTT